MGHARSARLMGAPARNALLRCWALAACCSSRFQGQQHCRMCGKERDHMEHWPSCHALALASSANAIPPGGTAMQ
eukprot:8588880-Lingulodinium_polyedra.AAC.1